MHKGIHLEVDVGAEGFEWGTRFLSCCFVLLLSCFFFLFPFFYFQAAPVWFIVFSVLGCYLEMDPNATVLSNSELPRDTGRGKDGQMDGWME